MNTIDKKGWKKVMFGDVCSNLNVATQNPNAMGIDRYVGLEHIETANLRITSWGNVEDGTTFTKTFKPGHVLFGKRRAYLKKAAVADFIGLCSSDILVFEANENMIEKRLLPFLVSSGRFFEYAVQTSAGSLSPRTKFQDLAKFEFLLPPKDQQVRLAELLWAADELGESYRTVIDNNSLVLKIFQQQTFQNKTEITLIKEVAKFSSGATPLRAENTKYFANGTIPWVKTLDLNNGIIADTEEKITETALNETSCKKLPAGTVLVAMYGGFNQIGRTGILSIEAATNQALCAILPDRSKVLPEYLLLSLNSLREYWKIVAVSSRKDPNITKSDVENFPFYLPDLLKQAEIIRQVEMINATHKKLTDTIEQSKQIQKQLINQIFSA